MKCVAWLRFRSLAPEPLKSFSTAAQDALAKLEDAGNGAPLAIAW